MSTKLIEPKEKYIFHILLNLSLGFIFFVIWIFFITFLFVLIIKLKKIYGDDLPPFLPDDSFNDKKYGTIALQLSIWSIASSILFF